MNPSGSRCYIAATALIRAALIAQAGGKFTGAIFNSEGFSLPKDGYRNGLSLFWP
jgi:hypothetical protein